jgi:hypothetical protein
MLKIKETWQKDPDYYLLTADANSLQARLATIDTAFDKEGIDPSLYELYKPGSPMGEDMHSSTSYATFGEAIGLKILDFEEDGKVWPCLKMQDIEVLRDGKEIIVTGAEVLPTDHIIGYSSGRK